MTNTSNYALRLPESTMNELKQRVKTDNTSINQFIHVAIAEKLAVLRTTEYFKERAARADMNTFWAVLENAGDESPIKGDELPEGYARRPRKQK